MKAPNKIYIPTILAADSVAYKQEGSIEYIRKGALLEWAKGFTEPKIFVSTLIEKLNSM